MTAAIATPAFRERPILFSAPMVRAILSGAKTQTRRVMSPQPEHLQRHEWRGKLVYEGEHRMWCWRGHTFENLWDEYIRDADRARLAALCPHGAPGDQLWVKETWTHDAPDLETCRAAYEDACPGIDYGPYYRATEVAPDTLRWRPSIFMPRWASRITLEVTEVRVQRLQEISEDDARAEGVEPYTPPHGHISPDQHVPGPGFDRCRLGDQPHRLPFADLWDSINGKPRPMLDDDGEPVLDDDGRSRMVASRSWANNPWVWAVTFRRLQ